MSYRRLQDKSSGVGRENIKKDLGNTDKGFVSLALPAELQNPLGFSQANFNPEESTKCSSTKCKKKEAMPILKRLKVDDL